MLFSGIGTCILLNFPQVSNLLKAYDVFSVDMCFLVLQIIFE